MPAPTPQTPTERTASNLMAVSEARTRLEAQLAAEAEARRLSRTARAQLASAIRVAAATIYGNVLVFCDIVQDIKGTPAKTVRNGLYITFSNDVLTRCIEVLDDKHLASGDGQSRCAA